MKDRTLEIKKAGEEKKENKLEKVQSVLTSGGIIRHHDLLRDAIYDTGYAWQRPSKEDRNLFDDSSRPEGERRGRGKAEEERKGKERGDKIEAKRKDENELEKAQSVLTSGGIIRHHDLLRDAIYDMGYAWQRPSKEDRNLFDDSSRPEGERRGRGKRRRKGKGKKGEARSKQSKRMKSN